MAARVARPRAGQVTGELLVTVGIVLLLFAFYESFWTNLQSGRLQGEANTELESAWQNPRSAPTGELGNAFAKMHIPAYGEDWQFAILRGTGDEVLWAGPGHYTGTQMPGEAGNFAVAGHRVGRGAPFNDLGELRACDAVVVETATEWITYRVLPITADDDPGKCFTSEQVQRIAAGDYAGVPGRHITTPGDVGVLDPVPGAGPAAAEPSMEAILTLTTCHPQFSNAERMIVHAMEVATEEKIGDRRPAVMEER